MSFALLEAVDLTVLHLIFRGTIRRSSVTHLTLNSATVDLSVLQMSGSTLRPPTSNQLIQVDSVHVEQGPQDHLVLMGNRKWIKEKNFIEIPTEVESKLIAQEQLGHTSILAAIDGE